MCLLNALQQRLTCSTAPWLPVGDPQMRRLPRQGDVATPVTVYDWVLQQRR